MAKDFVHLHLHTDYSLLDGACPISWAKLKDPEGKLDLVTTIKNSGMTACAITDHGVMGGCLEFHDAMKKAGLKPIIGCETYVAPHSNEEMNSTIPHIKGYHLILLAKNEIGYHNLCHIISDAHTRGFYYKPRTDREFLARHSEGIIAMSACLQGEIDREILRGGYDAGEKKLFEYLDIFGRDNFYLELMYHHLEDQKTVNKVLIELGKKNDIPMVATNDVHYLKREYAKSQEIMLCIQTRTTMDDPRHFRMENDEFYFKDGDEMFEVWGKEAPEALTNTLAIAERCNVDIGYTNHYPEYQLPSDFVSGHPDDGLREAARKQAVIFLTKKKKESAAKKEQPAEPDPITEEEIQKETQILIPIRRVGEYLKQICLYGTGKNTVCGYQKKYGYDPFNPPEELKEDAKKKLDRLSYELEVINTTRYPSYFLCVWDFINWAKEHDIPVGAGRGSGAGSLVAYLSGITDIDPIKYDLLFERFLNPDRVSPPDFDTDFCERNRQKVIDYVINKYGADSVSQIGTYGQLKAKAVIKDVARALSRTPAEGNMITKMVPDDPKMTLSKAIKESPELKELLDKEKWVQEIFDYARPIEMLNRQMGIHACGVIISNAPLANLLPLGRGAHDEVITQYTAPLCEHIGLLKMDFLGLRTLTLIQDAVDNIRKSRGFELDMNNVPLDDKATYELLNRGDTVSVFQLESGGMQELCRKFGVENIKHIIALVAIYRPGPMQFIDLFVGRKKGTIKLEYDHPLMEKYLNETYGIMLYQEQIMQVVQVLAGFSLGQADILRRAIGKKKIKDMEAQHDKFIEGCFKTNQISKELAERIWENIKKFADYGFNKSHSAAYALLSYRTAYLKANFRPEFMAAVLTSELSNSAKITFIINECRSTGIPILPPDVNSSDVNFTVDKNAIRFGLGAIKGFGQGVSMGIIQARKDGPFKSLVDLLERTEGLNAKSLESLIRSGALDSTGLKRSQLMAIIDSSISAANERKRDKATGQGNLFDMLGGDFEGGFGEVQPPDIPEFEDAEILNDEKQLLGFYVSGHPLAKYSKLISSFSSANLAQISEMPTDVGVKLGGMIKSVARKFTKAENKPFAILQLEDLTGTVECVVYNRTYETCKELLVDESRIFVTGFTKRADENSPVGLMLDSVIPLEEIPAKDSRELLIYLDEKGTDQQVFNRIIPVLKNSPGQTAVILCVKTAKQKVAFIEAGQNFAVRVTPDLLAQLENILGKDAYKIKADPSVPQPRIRREWKKDKPKEEQNAV